MAPFTQVLDVDYSLTPDQTSNMEKIKNFLSSLGDESYEDILTHFAEIPYRFYYDLFVANTSLSDGVKTEICRGHFDVYKHVRMESTIEDGNRTKLTIPTKNYPRFLAPLFEEHLLSKPPAENRQLIFMDEIGNFPDDFVVNTLDFWLDPTSPHYLTYVNFFAMTRGWNFTERYLVPLAQSNDELMWEILSDVMITEIVPEAFLDNLIERDVKFVFLYAWVNELTVDRWNFLRQKIFDRLDSEPEFVARFTYSDIIGPPGREGHPIAELGQSPILEEIFNDESISRSDIVKASFLWQMCSFMDRTDKDDLTDGLFEDFIAENYPMMLTIFDATDTDFEEHFLNYSYDVEFYYDLRNDFGENWWTEMAFYCEDMALWRYPNILDMLRATPEMRQSILQNENVTLDIVRELIPLSDEEFILLAGNNLPIQKDLEAELKAAEQAEHIVHTHFDMEGTPQQRTLTGLREARSLYPR